ncbi:FadR/GntR family transcriptional regulator [Oerskovia flava]|uniref:FadR/GntR family transcriptional regulator n=1 Tax=Oerskovia flava TaxID=2986422 RepID=UPI00223F9B70|nr:FadR/GntR family transcriptional regulator [Oerskovia sp. JB1-3-2]
MPSSPSATHPHRPSLIDAAVEQLRGRIADGQWPVGSRIPTEPELVELLHVGRNTAREAVQSLVHSGLLERRQGSGTYVLAASELTVAIGREIAGANRRDVLETRRALEVEMARLAARRRSEADVTTLRALSLARDAALASGDVDEFVTADLALHRAIAAAGRNPVLHTLYEHLVEAVGANIRENVRRRDAVGHSHATLVEAIAIGDDEAAARETAAYLTRQIAPPEPSRDQSPNHLPDGRASEGPPPGW